MCRLEGCRDQFVAVSSWLAIVKCSNLDWFLYLLFFPTIESHRVQLLMWVALFTDCFHGLFLLSSIVLYQDSLVGRGHLVPDSAGGLAGLLDGFLGRTLRHRVSKWVARVVRVGPVMGELVLELHVHNLVLELLLTLLKSCLIVVVGLLGSLLPLCFLHAIQKIFWVNFFEGRELVWSRLILAERTATFIPAAPGVQDELLMLNFWLFFGMFFERVRRQLNIDSLVSRLPFSFYFTDLWW